MRGLSNCGNIPFKNFNELIESNQAIVKLYLNGYNYLDKKGELLMKSTAIKSTNAPFHIGTKVEHSDIINTQDSNHTISISDLTYFNYSVTDNQIRSLFNSGFSKKPFVPASPPDVIAYPIADINKNTLYSNVKPY